MLNQTFLDFFSNQAYTRHLYSGLPAFLCVANSSYLALFPLKSHTYKYARFYFLRTEKGALERVSMPFLNLLILSPIKTNV